jgi:catalase (peroxidase I)
MNASQDQTDANSFAELEQVADGFRNYIVKKMQKTNKKNISHRLRRGEMFFYAAFQL